MIRLHRALLFYISLALAGCAVGPNYKRPDVARPGNYRDQAANPADRSFADNAWWDIFDDPQLKQLIHEALVDGFDVRIAAQRVIQARAIAAEVRGQFFPGVGYIGNADRGRNALLGNVNPAAPGTTASGFDGYFGAVWELDIWGRVRRLDEAARAQYLETEAARRGVLLSLVSEVATDYFQLLELDAELAIAHDETNSFNDSLRLFNRRLAGGISSRLETASAGASAAAAAARIPAIERAITIQENEICILLGRTPGPIERGPRLADKTIPPEVPAGLPSQLLERRPDVIQAEQAARAANAQIGVTVGGFLPRIGLSALFGAVSPELEHITSRKSELWSAGAQVTGPLFQGGGLHGQYEAARAVWEQAKLQYQQSALSAFADVSNALISRQKLVEQRKQLQVAVDAYGDAVRVATQRYASGNASYFEVLQAQQQLFPAEASLAQTNRDEFTAYIQLYRALGGGWNLSDAGWVGQR